MDSYGTTSALSPGIDKSGSVTLGGTAQSMSVANSRRKALYGMNISSGDLWINEVGGTAAADTAGSYKVASGAMFEISTNQAISVVGATTGQKWTATEVI